MNKLLDIIKNSNKIVIFTGNYNQDSLKSARYFYDYIYNRFLGSDYVRDIIIKQHLYNTQPTSEKSLYLFYGINVARIAQQEADLVLGINGTEIKILKCRYFIVKSNVFDLMDIEFFQRKDKLNKLLKKIRNEKRTTTKINR